ncbi:MAG: Ig-like domain repeat protein, partial [Anaerolineales bacterium]
MYSHPNTTLTIENSRISGNSAEETGGISSSGSLTFIDSTVSGNTGAGIGNGGSLTVEGSTFSGNNVEPAIVNGTGGD